MYIYIHTYLHTYIYSFIQVTHAPFFVLLLALLKMIAPCQKKLRYLEAQPATASLNVAVSGGTHEEESVILKALKEFWRTNKVPKSILLIFHSPQSSRQVGLSFIDLSIYQGIADIVQPSRKISNH